MIDEEMAEEYKVDYGIDLCCLCRECEIENINPCQHKKDAMYGYKDGFLAGLKAGRPQWHDLRKDPNDLPKHSVRVLVLLEDKLYEISSISADNRWVCTDYYTGEDKVIAWCEIPTFDKE